MAPKLWVTRGVTWVTSAIKARVGRRTYLRVTNVYRLVNSLTQLMVYPMPLVTDLLEDLDKYK
ncbi:reverse transcriptase [Phytophthora megakarya]|uniref:Reverse transcriptase n=1 Tax=Phytophthora megakarya TaxID=4795 RepID=A0A225V1I1_9STRA|nr:reverse transcriptase [Phytophthora megakarya]